MTSALSGLRSSQLSYTPDKSFLSCSDGANHLFLLSIRTYYFILPFYQNSDMLYCFIIKQEISVQCFFFLFFGISVGSCEEPHTHFFSLNKEVIQPHLPVRLPCYDFTPLTDSSFTSLPLTVGVTSFRKNQLGWCDGRCVQGPRTYSPQ